MLTIYKASAGSGKTYTLAYEYIKLLLGIKRQSDGSYLLNLAANGSEHVADRHRHILAITFTNKATEEMKRRIIDELSVLATMPTDPQKDSSYAEKLIAEFGCSRSQLQASAEAALNDLLFNYRDFNVSTIDSFFQTVLRAFAREVDRQGDYGIEIDEKTVMAEGVSMMLDDVNYGNPSQAKRILKWIRDYTLEMVENGKDASLFNRSSRLLATLQRFVEKMTDEVFKQHSDTVIKYLSNPQAIRKFIADIDKHIDVLRQSIKSDATRAREAYMTALPRREALNKVIANAIDAACEGAKIDVLDLISKKTIAKLRKWDSEPDTAIYVKTYLDKQGRQCLFPPDTLGCSLCEWINNLVRLCARIHSLENIRSACLNMEFLGFTWQYINRYREENNLILLSDTHDLLKRIINGCDAPFIYEKIGVALRHFLIDEFQDTSHMQWQDLRPLVSESLASANDNLIIGDEKQAIYRFRNSDSSLLHHVVANHDFPRDHTLRGNTSADNTNYRSAPGIVTFNNALFTRIAATAGVEGYENTVQSLAKQNLDLSSYITIYDTKPLPKVNDMPANYEITATEIIRQHKAGYRWSDIAVLVRRGKEAEQMVNYLRQYHPEIAVLSDEALLLRNSSAVKLIVSMLKLVDESYSPLSLPNLEDAKPRYASINDIRMMISRYDYFKSSGFDSAQSLEMALGEREPDAECAIDKSVIEIRNAHPSNLVSLVETIIEKTLSPVRRREEFAYIAAFQDEVIKYCQRGNNSIHAFLKWWDETSDRLAISSGSNQDAVTVMTVHKAKGLQWECVHIPMADWDMLPRSDHAWIEPHGFDFSSAVVMPPLLNVEVDRLSTFDGSYTRELSIENRHLQMIDNVNVTYVAYTRPKRELTICFNDRSRDAGDDDTKAENTRASRYVFNALQKGATSAEQTEGLCMDLATYLHDNDVTDETMPPGLIFVYGEPTKPKEEEKPEEKSEVLQVVESGTYNVIFRQDTAMMTSVEDATSRLGALMMQGESYDVTDEPVADESAEELIDQRQSAAIRGTHLHAIMADILTMGDIESAVQHRCNRLRLDKDTAAHYLDIITKAFEHAGQNAVRWFDDDAKVYREQSIYQPEGDDIYRPDRIVICPNGSVDVIDYKFTGEPLDSHVKQVQNYVNLLESMGFKHVKGYLWYPELNIIKTI